MSRFAGVGAFLALFLTASSIWAEIQGNVESLKTLEETLAANMQSIVTWRGQVVIADHINQAAREVTNSTTTKFAYAQDGRKLKFSSSQERLAEAGTVINSEGLRTDDSYVRSGPYSASDTSGLDAATNLIIIDELSAEKSGFYSPDFDPFTFMSVTGDDPVERIKFYYDNRKEDGLSNVRVTTSSSLVTISTSSADGNLQWEYVFDLAQGGLPVRVQGTSKSPESLDLRESTYVEIDGVWLPSTTEIKNGRGGKTDRHRTLTWTDHELNREIDPAEFTVASLTTQPGNTIIDKRSKTQVMIEPEEFHRKFKDVIGAKSTAVATAEKPAEVPKSRSNTFLIVTSLNVLVFAALLFSWLYFARARGATG